MLGSGSLGGGEGVLVGKLDEEEVDMVKRMGTGRVRMSVGHIIGNSEQGPVYGIRHERSEMTYVMRHL